MRASIRGGRGWEENASYPPLPTRVNLRAKLRVSRHRKVSFLSHLIVLSRAGRGGTLLLDRNIEWVPTGNSLIIIRFWETQCPPTPPLSQHTPDLIVPVGKRQ